MKIVLPSPVRVRLDTNIKEVKLLFFFIFALSCGTFCWIILFGNCSSTTIGKCKLDGNEIISASLFHFVFFFFYSLFFLFFFFIFFIFFFFLSFFFFLTYCFLWFLLLFSFSLFFFLLIFSSFLFFLPFYFHFFLFVFLSLSFLSFIF